MTKATTLWVFFGLFIVETICFGVVMAVWDFTIIDEMSDPQKVQQHIGEMSEAQRAAHAWMTATLDVAYPLTYGPLFAGIVLRTLHTVFVMPAMAVIPSDLIEGVIQVSVLSGDDTLLWLKTYITPLKLVLFVTAIIIAVFALAIEARNRRN
ncbi:MAG: hypothetical protein AAFR51_12670 [Pseudomonadota bacterium]